MLARGIELPAVGSLKDRVLRRGFAVERAIKMAEVETFLLAQNIFHGSAQSGKMIEELLNYFRKHINLEVFTNSHAEAKKQQEVQSLELLDKLNKLGKLSKKGK